MSATMACIAGQEIYQTWNAGRIIGDSLGRKSTPFGDSQEIFLVEAEGRRFYLLPRYGLEARSTAPNNVSHRANLYALKDLGVQYVLGWAPGGAITHNLAVGDLVVLSDLIDFTHLPDKTFFEGSPLGFLRQFPVFCPMLRRLASQVLQEMKLLYHGAGTAAVRDGPRLETPAEVRMLATDGAEIVTHAFVPEAFLAKELQVCYAAICYVASYAETGSRHRTFATGGLFAELSQKSDDDRVAGPAGAMSRIVAEIAQAVDQANRSCDCDRTMDDQRVRYGLSDDWRQWLA